MTQLRAREFGKSQNLQVTWTYAKDVPLHRDDRELSTEALHRKLLMWLERHDQDTNHLASVLPLIVGLPIRLTDRIDNRRDLMLYRGRRGRIYGWTPHPESTVEEVEGDLLMDRLPLVIYIKFDNASWKIGDLPEGVYPMTPTSRTWKVHKATGISARRTGFIFMPDFASTAHMIQGATLDAVFCDMQDSTTSVRDAQILAYVGASRVRLLSRIYILRPFSPTLFTQGAPKGPATLLQKLEGKLSAVEAQRAWDNEEEAKMCKDVMKKPFLCVGCYMRRAREYMHLPREFGCITASNAISTLYAAGQWRRCLRCRDEAPLYPCNVCV